MIGVLIVTHSNLGAALIEATQFIAGSVPDKLEAVSIDIREDAEMLRKKIAAAIKRLDSREGILILTDMFGGTPSNLSYSFLEEGKVEVISGVNLPMVIRAETLRKDIGLSELAQKIETFGKKSISLASGILKGNKKASGSKEE
ncbi:PTS sugar transporter subunit IIA [Desulfatirhabdium butyrativorans]|uniref:PTS sugar transporter subunit IIA n=1 Tax=Desulfatirhabdium butyrativorans TaxID=340467 RepID=UPI0003F7E67A|nr:PTS sugar transporter subunit IIA [Desulfatirhabdium butyrativorans]